MSKELRIIYTSSPSNCPIVTDHPGKVFAVIGPFDDHMASMEVQRAIEFVLRGWNKKPKR